MHKLSMAVALIFFSGTAIAEKNIGVYGEASVGRNSQTTDNSRSNLDGDDLNKLLIGWRASENWSINLSMSESSGKESVNPYTIEYKPIDLIISGRYSWNFSPKLNGYADFGLDYYDIKLTSTEAISTGEVHSISTKDDGVGFSVGLGASYQIMNQISALAQVGYIARPNTFDKSENQHDLNTTFFAIGARLDFQI